MQTAKLLILNAPGEIRTHGPRIRNPVLYPPELRGHKEYQLLTIIFFILRVNLCQSVSKVKAILIAKLIQPSSWHPNLFSSVCLPACFVRQGRNLYTCDVSFVLFCY
jgi:hypothetical protein